MGFSDLLIGLGACWFVYCGTVLLMGLGWGSVVRINVLEDALYRAKVVVAGVQPAIHRRRLRARPWRSTRPSAGETPTHYRLP
jgi:hypothetical protein